LLLELRVKDLGIIEDIDWKLNTGLNVITGETGAGKSLVIDAVELLLVGTASEDVIRHGAGEARIEGVFSLSGHRKSSALKTFLAEKGLNEDEDLLVINCEVRKQKAGVVRINGHTVTKTILRHLGRLLVDIHGQSDHLSLLDKEYHLDCLDAYGHTLEARDRFAQNVARLRALEAELSSLEEKEKDKQRQEEFLKYQIEEIRKADLHEGEDEELEQERHIIAFSEKLKEYSSQIYQSLNESSTSHYSASALAALNKALQALKKLVELDKALAPQLDYLEKTVYGVEEVARDIRSYGDKLEHDPQRLEEIESRLELLRNLKRKYGKTIAEILAYREKSGKELEGISLSAERRQELERECPGLKQAMGQMAGQLSQARIEAAGQLALNVRKELQDLEMLGMQFEVSITQSPSPSGIGGPEGTLYAYDENGIDYVEFMAATNPGEPLKPLAKIASTGEISRFTLALKSALSEADNIPVLIFDEIDIGVGGRSGDIIGKKLWNLAQNHQVICVTHLPQIASYADAHYCVHKEVSGSRTTSTLENLDDNLRRKELAVMLAGPGYSKTALKNAGELLQKAEDWKRARE
jgi:DNA repair protein RecN (Recombination protein N)